MPLLDGHPDARHWTIRKQGLTTRNFSFDVIPHGFGYAILFTLHPRTADEQSWKVYFKEDGTITHIRHTDAQPALATSAVEHVDPLHLRP